jgi:hypothetical protein
MSSVVRGEFGLGQHVERDRGWHQVSAHAAFRPGEPSSAVILVGDPGPLAGVCFVSPSFSSSFAGWGSCFFFHFGEVSTEIFQRQEAAFSLSTPGQKQVNTYYSSRFAVPGSNGGFTPSLSFCELYFLMNVM